MSSDAAILALLRAVHDGEGGDRLMDNNSLRTRLGWTAKDVAAALEAARQQMLVWGSRVGGTPAPQFADLELTVQGRRLLVRADADGER
jgi:hypothetical protein